MQREIVAATSITRTTRGAKDQSRPSVRRCEIARYLHSEAASNLSDFFFRFHFQGLKSLPRAENLLFLSKGGVLAPEPRLFVRKAAPFCFFAATTRDNFTFICIRHMMRARVFPRNISGGVARSHPTLVTSCRIENFSGSNRDPVRFPKIITGSK